MDFGFNETEEMVRASAREFLSREAGPALAKSRAANHPGAAETSDSFWLKVSEMGWPGLAIAEESGGSEMGMMPLAALMEQWAAHLAPGPMFESAVLAAPLIESAAPLPLRREVLPALADGSKSVAVAVLEEQALWRPEAVNAVAVKTGDGWAITGEKRFVAYGAEADWLLVAALSGDSEDGISLFLVGHGADGMAYEAVEHATGTPTYTVSFNETPVSAARLIGEEGHGWTLIEDMKRRGSAFRAVQLAGIGQAVIDRTVQYVKDRKQFGQPVGSFQAIQHMLADMAVAVRSARLQAYRAVWSVENSATTMDRDVARAAFTTSSLIPDVCWKAHQAHGAIGFTWEHDLHLFTRHAVAWAAEFGGETESVDALANSLPLQGS